MSSLICPHSLLLTDLVYYYSIVIYSNSMEPQHNTEAERRAQKMPAVAWLDYFIPAPFPCHRSTRGGTQREKWVLSTSIFHFSRLSTFENDADSKGGPLAWRVTDHSVKGWEFPCVGSRKENQHACVTTNTNLIKLG